MNLKHQTISFEIKVAISSIIVTLVGILVTLKSMGYSFPQIPWHIVLLISVGILILAILLHLWQSWQSRRKIDLPPYQGFLDKLFEDFYHHEALILLAQSPGITSFVLDEIEIRLKVRFGTENTYRLTPPVEKAEITEQTYFSLLAKQCGLSQPIHNAGELETALWEKLQGGNVICLLISRLEKGDQRADELAKLLRNLLETTQLRVLLCGGQKLAELKFANANLSLLNIAGVKEWPELIGNDLRYLLTQQGKNSLFQQKELPALLTISGGHPTLLQHCFEYRTQNPNLPINDYPQRLKQEPELVAAFTRFQPNPQQAQQIREWLAQPEVAPAPPYIFDDLLREVYWLNLLVKRNNRLVWRCEAIREAGQEILGNI